jgi:hypothetical protein
VQTGKFFTVLSGTVCTRSQCCQKRWDLATSASVNNCSHAKQVSNSRSELSLLWRPHNCPSMFQAGSKVLLGLFLIVTNVKCTPLNRSTRTEASNGDIPIKHVFRENRVAQRLGHAFVIGSRASPDVTHDVIFVVKHKNLDYLARILDERSDPSSSY